MSQNQFLPFLQALSDHNHKDWMDQNRNWYLEVKEDFLKDVTHLLQNLTELEPDMIHLRPKDCIFRQNRDVRFSPNKNPYKINLAAYFSVGGKKSAGPGYYLHIQPGESFLAGGIWMPDAETLKRIRQEIDYLGSDLINILEEPDFKSTFDSLEGEQLKTSPRDYPADHPFIALLRYKSFIVSQPLSDEEIKSGKYKEKTLASFKKMKPFQDFLGRAIEEVEGGENIL
ncbi:DUF2461 domain-containing protein [Pararhodonellum marinum]|uniref:DUF2461 domain-containing protein n=1 Tax=Pararhodonellum marinum TaxID=2755358 RepID=UPI00188EFF56|nr:DUF2461 domain-containing protein [Pararhodonellum marinum]